MGSCIICGASVDGRICELHEEDVVFEFRGSQPDELTSNRFYRGSVDGYAEFGIFVDIGDHVTGLLHKSELDRRLDSMELDAGDTVFVQVQNVRDNGNVDLGWSIRQDESDFRGTLIDDPDADHAVLAEKEDAESPDESGAGVGEPTAVERSSSPPEAETEAGAADAEAATTEEEADGATTETSGSPDESQQSGAEPDHTPADPESLTVDELADNVGALVRIEGEVAEARQTSGPTVFTLRDETGTVECAAFKEAGVRAYPEVDAGDIVRIEGEVERRRGDLQVETEALVVLEDDERAAVSERMEDALVQRARPEDLDPLAPDTAVEAVLEDVRDAATAIRRAIIEGRPIVVRHAATADGYIAATAIERAALPLIRDEHQNADAEYHYFDRRPLEGTVYDMNDATKDVTGMLSDRERHGETLPLFVFVAAGGSTESLDGFDLLSVYDARRVVIDERAIDEAVADAVDVLVSPMLAEAPETSATALGVTVAAHVNPEVQTDLRHLPAVSFWETIPDGYADLAAETGYDADSLRELREAVALEAYYQSYEDKRELIIDLLFGDEAADPSELAGHISQQYRTRMDDAVETAEANMERREVSGATVLVLDTEAYTHRYEFPPTPQLLDELHRRHREDADALLGIATDEAYVRTDAPLDVRDLVATAAEAAPKAALDARGAREGRIEFLAGERDPAREALIEALAGELSSAATV